MNRTHQVTLVWQVGGEETVQCQRVYREGDELVLEQGRTRERRSRRILVKGLHEYYVVEL